MSSILNIKSKLPSVGTTIFSTMSKMAVEHGAINLSQGFPDFACSPKLVELVNKYMQKGMNQYAPMPGIVPLRERIAQKTEELYNFYYHPESEITVTSGATEALFAAISAIVHPGDEVIVFEPCYDSYIPAILLCGGIPKPLELKQPGFSIDWNEVSKTISSKTKAIIINTPHNPSGSILLKEDLKKLEAIALKHDFYVISDEVYEHIIFDKQPHASVIESSVLRDRSFIISSFGKTFHTTGWKIGYCLAPAPLTAEFRKVHQFLTFSSCTPIQYAISDYLADKENYIELPAFYEQKRDYFRNLLIGSRFKLEDCSGTYFQLLNYGHISEESDLQYAIRLTKDHKVASIPVSVFYSSKKDDKFLRFCFAKEKETLELAAERLCKI